MEQALLKGLRGVGIGPTELARPRRGVSEIAVLEGPLHPGGSIRCSQALFARFASRVIPAGSGYERGMREPWLRRVSYRWAGR